eukprot:CAMPEP_0196637042 /NCGR_PEP_ID=MMETSP1085-20130531/196_1 /TAXON_ID=41879 ORGANISM="Pycnococcus sp, Strain CCMP1998" /NCGR_SAMPLE_ID=MMETSP1085 /ASSEMBLY_ACC=CAM_ASM_000807 /LENGTH=87 /DNA_ID=CAMNT_0041965483 /DNA_START=34 /DNA_END=293 /DNA_ORIENTATION=-
MPTEGERGQKREGQRGGGDLPGFATAEDDVVPLPPAAKGFQAVQVIRGNDLHPPGVDGEGQRAEGRDEGLPDRPVHHLVPDQRRVLR